MADILTYDDEELVAVTVDDRNWRGIGISLLVIAAIFSLIGFAIFLLTPPNELDNYGANKIDLKEILSKKFVPKNFKTQWISDYELLLQNSQGNISILHVNRNFTSEPLIHNSIIRRFNVLNVEFSKNRKYALLESNTCQNYQYISISEYYIYNVSNEVVLSVKEDLLYHYFKEKKIELDKKNDSVKNSFHNLKQTFAGINLQYAKWGKNESDLIILVNNNIYYIKEIQLQPKIYEITDNGLPSIIYNGIPDWTYSKFINKLNKDEKMASIYWSNTGHFLAYATFNNTNVGDYTIYFYTDSTDGNLNLSPKSQTKKIPLAGQPNPEVTITVISSKNLILNKESKKSYKLKLPKEISDIDHYFVNLKWMKNNNLLLAYSSRTLNHTWFIVCESKAQFKCSIKMQLTDCAISLADLSNMIMQDELNSEIQFVRYPRKDADMGRYFHLASFSLEEPYLNFQTHGAFDITKLLAFHSAKNVLYFQATKINEIHSRHIYSINLNKDAVKSVVCLTCDLKSNSSGFEFLKQAENQKQLQAPHLSISEKITDLKEWIVNCNNFQASFNPTFEYFVFYCAGPIPPYFELWKNDKVPKKIVSLFNNKKLENILTDKRLPKEHYFAVPLDLDHKKAYVKLITPAPPTKEQRDKAEEEEFDILYPMIVQSVSLDDLNETIDSEFQIGWPQYLASKREIIYAKITIKNRSKLQSYSAKSLVLEKQKNMQNLVKDQLKVIEYLVNNFPNIDKNRVVIFGWGSSAFSALNTLAEDYNNLLNSAIAIAPIVNWKLMDSVTAESNFGVPIVQESHSVFEKNNLLYKRANLIKKKFLIVHGTGDEKIHVQHTMQLTKLLINNYDYNKEGPINYQIQLYPDDDHHLSLSKQHLYILIESYLDKFFFPRIKQNPSFDS